MEGGWRGPGGDAPLSDGRGRVTGDALDTWREGAWVWGSGGNPEAGGSSIVIGSPMAALGHEMVPRNVLVAEHPRLKK